MKNELGDNKEPKTAAAKAQAPAPTSAKKERGADFSAARLSEILNHDEAFQGLLSVAERELFERYAAAVIETNRSLNLTALTKAEDVAYLHFWDSLTLLPLLDRLGYRCTDQPSFTDVGSGAGFPGIPIKIMRPQWRVQLIDALGKRVRFLNSVCAELGLKGIRALHLRAEDAGRLSEQRERSDLVTARAVASLSVLVEYCLPLLKVGGHFIAMKAQADEELEAAGAMIKTLGGKLLCVERFQLPDCSGQRSLIVIKKIHASPPGYPRSNAQIKAKKR